MIKDSEYETMLFGEYISAERNRELEKVMNSYEEKRGNLEAFCNHYISIEE